MAKRAAILKTKYFSLIIGATVVAIILAIGTFTPVFDVIDIKVRDIEFGMKPKPYTVNLTDGSSVDVPVPRRSDDILIAGIDSASLYDFGRFPFPRFRYSNFIDSLARIKDQSQRERALLIDVFFIDPSDPAIDAGLRDSIASSGRVFLETVLERAPSDTGSEQEMLERQLILNEKDSIKTIMGDWAKMAPFFRMEPPLKELGAVTKGSGHATYEPDEIDKIFRHVPLIIRNATVTAEIPFDQIGPGFDVKSEEHEQLFWIDKLGNYTPVETPVTQASYDALKKDLESYSSPKEEDTNGDGKIDRSYYSLRLIKSYFVPSITLSLACEYFNKKMDDVEVVLGDHILIRAPQAFDPEKGEWGPYSIKTADAVYAEDGNLVKAEERRTLEEVKIPIDGQANMLINFVGPASTDASDGTQTYNYRSFSSSSYSEPPEAKATDTWPKTKRLADKIVLVGPFARGVGSDDKSTPMGLMYGIEVHANAINTIIMDNFLYEFPKWIEFAVMAFFVLFLCALCSRIPTLWSFLAMILLVFGFFFASYTLFNSNILMGVTRGAFGMVLAFISVVVYRAMTEEKDKKRIRETFGKYVSPSVVDQLVDITPELGGVDKELTVLFSDIRGFTTLSENMSPQELVNHLNVYLTAMTDLILEYRGTLDKYVGDEVMCFWGAPLPQANHAELACQCAIMQMRKLAELNEGWPAHKRINIGIGVNSGIMTVGNMGSPVRMNYTLMGDNVNLGARLEGTNKTYATNIIVSEYTYGLVKDKFVFRELDNIRVKGKNKPVVIYELVDSVEPFGPPAAGAKREKR